MQAADSSPPSSPPFRFDSASLAAEIKIYLQRHERAVGELISSGDERAGAEASRRWARAFDGLICSLYCAVRPTIDNKKAWDALSLVAVGSYGRGNFGFRSDLDLRFLCTRTQETAKIAEAILYPLWDAGIQIGHQVVTISDTIALAKTDLPTATTLLDCRHLAGNAEQSNSLQEKAFSSLFAPKRVHEFLLKMHTQAWERWDRFGNSVYLLEPDVKNGQGGLRDLDVVYWAAQARWRVKSLSDLQNIGVLDPVELTQIEEAQAFISRVRNILHYFSPRRTERLSFDAQEMVALKMGYGKGGAGCEALMTDYYRHARAISTTREALLVRAEPISTKKLPAKQLHGGISLGAETICISDLSQISVQPVLVLRAYWEAVHREFPLDRLTRDAIVRALNDESVCERLRGDVEAAQLFRRLVRQPRKVKFKRNSTLSEFHDVGLLLAMIPEFRPVVGRVHHDIYHVYTVDVHSIATVDRLRSYCRGELTEEHPLATRLAADIARPQVLFMAALLHDIGKDTGGRAHGERGAFLVRGILQRLGVQEHDIVEVQQLVLQHLRMYHVASRRDIDDPETIDEFRRDVHGPEGLKELYILTLCDVATTSPAALTTWKSRMLEELYLSTLRSFDGLPSHCEERAMKLRSATQALCPERGEAEFLEHFLNSVPDRYMYANEPQHIVSHARLARQSEGHRSLVDLIGSRAPYVELGFVTDDKPGALTMITAALAANRLPVISAQLHSWTDRTGRRRVLDMFWVRSGADTDAPKRMLPRLRADLDKLLAGEEQPEELITSRRGSRVSERPSPVVPVTINFDNRSSSIYTIIEVLAEDQPALLYRLAKILREAALEVALAKINTEGNSVVDVFYVVDQEGKKLTDSGRIAELTVKLRDEMPRRT